MLASPKYYLFRSTFECWLGYSKTLEKFWPAAAAAKRVIYSSDNPVRRHFSSSSSSRSDDCTISRRLAKNSLVKWMTKPVVWDVTLLLSFSLSQDRIAIVDEASFGPPPRQLAKKTLDGLNWACMSYSRAKKEDSRQCIAAVKSRENCPLLPAL